MSNATDNVYYMEKDGAVIIPEKYEKMNLKQITEECARLSKEKTNSNEKKEKPPCKTKFAI